MNTLKTIFPNLTALGIGISSIYFLDWNTTDLIWSLWLSSLTLGYLTILSTLAGGVYFGLHVIFHNDFPKKYRSATIGIGGFVVLFMLGFFSLHFCGFHSGHAVFLNSFYPLEGVPKNAFMGSFMNLILLWKIVFQHIMPLYWTFLISTAIAERKNIFASLRYCIRLVREGINKNQVQEFIGKGGRNKKLLRDPFSQPYINVIRMHLLIFFFVGCHWLKADSFIVFVVVYCVYFFPREIIRNPMEQTA